MQTETEKPLEAMLRAKFCMAYIVGGFECGWMMEGSVVSAFSVD